MLPISTISRRFRLQSSAAHENAKQHTRQVTSTRFQETTLEHRANCCSLIRSCWNRLSKVRGHFLEEVLDIHFFPTILAKLARTPFKLQMLDGKTCHVCTQLEHVFFVKRPRLDENDGVKRI